MLLVSRTIGLFMEKKPYSFFEDLDLLDGRAIETPSVTLEARSMTWIRILLFLPRAVLRSGAIS